MEKPNPAREHLIAAASFSFSLLLFELSLTRLFSVLYSYHSAFVMVALAFAGIGTGMAAAFRRGGKDSPIAASLFPIALPFGVVVAVMRWDSRFEFLVPAWLVLGTSFVALGIPFALFGYLMASLYRVSGSGAGRLLTADLSGGGGACLAYPLVIQAGPEFAILFAAGIGSVGTLCLQWNRERWPAAMKAGILIALSGIQCHWTPVRIPLPVRREEPDTRTLLAERWNSFSRVAAYPLRDDPGGMFLSIDSLCGARLPRFGEGEGREAQSVLATAPEKDAILILGAGAGADMREARNSGFRRIVGVEINHDVVDLGMHLFADRGLPEFLSRTASELKVEDGRTYVSGSRERFSVILIPWIQSLAAVPAGALSLTENSLFTVEAFRTYLERLSRDGWLVVNCQWPKDAASDPEMAMRLVEIARESSDPGLGDRLSVLVHSGPRVNHAVLILKRRPFDPAETAALRTFCGNGPFKPAYLPGFPAERHATLAAWIEDHRLPADLSGSEVRATTDDRPFFFFRNLEGLAIPFVRWWFPLFLLGMPGLMFFRACRDPGLPPAARGRLFRSGVSFLLVGAGFTVAENAWITRLVSWLGHPGLAVQGVFASILFGAGLGGFCARKTAIRPETGAILAAVILVIGAVLLRSGSGWILEQGAGVRLSVIVAGIWLSGIPMGLTFSGMLERAGSAEPKLLPWLLGLNALGGAAGSLIGTGVCLTSGVTAALMLAAGCYGLSALGGREKAC